MDDARITRRVNSVLSDDQANVIKTVGFVRRSAVGKVSGELITSALVANAAELRAELAASGLAELPPVAEAMQTLTDMIEPPAPLVEQIISV